MTNPGKLYFKHSYGFTEKIKDGIGRDECCAEINRFVKEINPDYKIHYVRTWEKDGVVHFDVGSHSEFFYWAEKELAVMD